MKFEYDPEVDALFIWFVDIEKENKYFTREIWPKELCGDIGLLFDKDGKLMGLEVLNAAKYFSEKQLEADPR